MFVFARLLDNKNLYCRYMKLKILYRGQLFRLNFQRLISPAFPTFRSTFLEMQKISSFVHIEVNWKLDAWENHQQQQDEYPMGVLEPEYLRLKRTFSTNKPTRGITTHWGRLKSELLRKAIGF